LTIVVVTVGVCLLCRIQIRRGRKIHGEKQKGVTDKTKKKANTTSTREITTKNNSKNRRELQGRWSNDVNDTQQRG
jgi:hypothetical protein